MKFEMTAFQKHVDLRIDTLLPTPYFAIMLVSSAREITGFVQQCTNRHGSEPIDLSQAQIAWPYMLRDYFHPIQNSDKLRQMRVRSHGNARQELRNFVLGELERALADIQACGVDANDIESSPLKFYHAFLTKKATENNRQLRDLQPVAREPEKGLDEFATDFVVTIPAPVKNSDLARIAEAGLVASELPGNASWSNVTFKVSPAFDTSSPDKVAKRHLRDIFAILATLCRNWLKFRFGDRFGHSVLFPGIGLHQSHILASASLPLAKVQEDNRKFVGFFDVIREARGTVTNIPGHRNTVVRDLLWLRPHLSEIGSHGISDFTAEGHGHRLGFYISAFDKMVYEVKRVIYRDNSLMIDAIAHLDNSGSKSMCVYFPLMKPSSLLCSFGGMLGHAHDAGRLPTYGDGNTNYDGLRTVGYTDFPETKHRRVGGWTAVFYRSNRDETLSSRLQNYFAMYSESLRLDDRDEYDRNIEFFFRFVDEKGLIGFLFSDLMLRQAVGSHKDRLIETSKHFRDFFTVDEDYARSLRSFLREKIDAVHHDRDRLLEFVERMAIEQLMYCITPQYNGILSTARFTTNLAHFSDPSNLISAQEYHDQYIRPKG